MTKLEPHEAIALLIKMRLRHLTPRTAVDALAKSTKDPAPDLAECRSSTTWGWRFYAAAHDILGGDANIDALEKLVKDAKAPSERAAAAVFACALSVEDGNPQGGLDVVDGALTHSDYSDVDRAWLLLHRGRCLAELGDLANARLCAVDVQKIRNVAVDDPTAMAITGSGTDLIFRLNPWSTDSKEVIGVEEVIKGRDTLASWWSRQEVADGLEIQFTDQFQVWVGNSEGPELDPTSLRLRSATLLAGIAADHSSWRRSHTLLAQYTLMNDSSAEEIAKSLAALRHAGEHKLIEDTVRHLLRVGPATAVRAAAGVVRLELGTRTSLHADLQTISSASDVLETDWADTHARWILARLNDTGDLATRLQPTFSLEHALLKVLSNLVSVISAPVLREVIEHIKESPQQGDIGSSYDWARVVENVPISEWTSDDRTAVAVRSKDGPALKEAFDRILAKHDSAHRETIQKRIEEGNLSALSAFGDVRDLDDDIAKGVIEKLSSATTQRISDLKSGSFAMGVKDFASDLVTLNVWYPQLASWDSISDLLTTELPFVSDRQGVLARIAILGKKIPPEVVDVIAGPLHDLMVALPSEGPSFSDEDVRGSAAAALAAVRPDAISDEELWDLMRGNVYQRAAAVEVVSGKKSANRFDVLVAMSRDTDPWVRAVIARQIAREKPVDGDIDRANLLRRLLANEGTLVARMVASTINSSPPDDGTDKVVGMLRGNFSAGVRRAIAAYDAKRNPE